MVPTDRIAIVGVAVRFPGSGTDLGQFWSNVANAVDCSREVPAGRWLLPPGQILEANNAHPDTVPHARGYYLDPFDAFDTGVPNDFLAALDPLFHLILDVGQRAWRSSKTESLDRRKIGVVLGNICLPTDKASALAREYLSNEPHQTNPLNRYVAGLPAGLLAKSLGLGGGTFTLDAACASSLYAIKLACDELLSGRADAMLAGGANRSDCLYTQMGFARLKALSPSGKCSPFSAAADGLLVGEGAGVFVLKRLADAVLHGDTIHGVIAGIGLSNDIHGNMLAPAKEGQLRAMRSAYERAGWSPKDVGLIECHATGTPVGDAVEFESLRELWGESNHGCAIGSVKSTVGHLLTGAGSAALAKVLLAIAHRTRPPQANFEGPNSNLRYVESPFRVLNKAEAWEPSALGNPLRAAVSGFGFGGVNAHLLVEEYIPQAAAPVLPVRPTLALKPLPKLATMGVKNMAPAPLAPPVELVVATPEPVAIIGMAAHCGPWETLQAFQEFALGGGERHAAIPKRNGWGDAGQCPPGFFIEALTVPLGRFRIPPKELEEMLPQQVLMLQTAAAALDDCRGTKPLEEADVRSGVFIGLGLDPNTTNYHRRWAARANGNDPEEVGPPLTADRTMGSLGSIAASRIARVFRFGGPSFTICSEESSAGRAVDLAVRALRAKELDRAVVGGVDLAGDPRSVLPREADRSCVPGEGAAALVFKRLKDAVRDGDRVYAVIRGVGSSSSGTIAGLAPDAAGYASSLMRACSDAVIDPKTVGYLEAAATGGEADDQPETEALSALQSATARIVPLTIGTIRRQIGQIGAAAAAAGLVKACLALYHQILPSDAGSQFWLKDDEAGPRRALVAATGVDGSTVHIVVEETATPPIAVETAQPLGARTESIFVVEGDTPNEILTALDSLTEFAKSRQDRPIEHLAREWFRRTPPAPARKRAVTLVPRSAAELIEQATIVRGAVRARPESSLPDLSQPETHPVLRDRVFYSSKPLGPKAKLAVVFPGSGNQFPGMGRDLGMAWPEVLRKQQSENRRLRSQYAPDRFWTGTISVETTAKEFLFGQVTQGSLGADLLTVLGIRADALVGQSLGESAGLFGLRVWAGRDEMLRRIHVSTLFGSDLAPPYDSARQFWHTPKSTTLDWISGVLAVSADDVRAAVRPGLRAYLLIVTTPNECVIGGVRADVEKLVQRFSAPFFPLSGVTLAHCEAGKPVEGPYRELHTLPTTPPPGLTVYSGAWGRSYKPTSGNCADSITAGLLDTIDFPAVVNAAYKDGVRYFVEAGPGNSATRMIAATLTGKPHLARAMTAPRQDAVSLVLRLVAHLIAERFPVNLAKLYGEATRCAGHMEVVLSTGPTIELPVGMPPPREPEPEPVILTQVVPEPVEEVQPPEPPPPVFVRPVPKPVEPTVEPLRNLPNVVAWANGLSPFVAAAASTQTATAAAHDVFLRVQSGFTQTAVAALQLQTELIRRATGGGHSTPVVPRSLTNDQCFTFAAGKIGDVLGPLYAEADSFPTRVRLPDGPLMLVDRILQIDGEPKSMTRGRVVTDHHVHAKRWYLDAGRIPTCVAVESGQADLFLSGFLGIDFQTRGLAVYRLIDAVVTFHRALPKVGDTILYDIHIDQFVKQAGSWLFRFRFESTVNGEPLLSMTHGVAGFFTNEVLNGGQGIVHTKLDKMPMPGKKPADWRDLVPLASGSLGTREVDALRRGDLATAFGPDFGRANLKSPMKLPGGMLRLVDRFPLLDPKGGRFGLGFVRAEYDIHPQDWFLTCHFVDDQVMPGTLMYECCLHTLRVLLMRLGWVGEDGEVASEPVPEISSRLKCRGQVIATTKLVTYEVSIKELGYRPEPYCVADALMYADGKPIVEISNMTLRMSGLNRAKLEAVWGKSTQSPPVATGGLSPKRPLYDSTRILAFSNGNPSDAFGEPYKVFDYQRKIARLPGPPYQFLDRVTAVAGPAFILKEGSSCETQYDVPADEWYFKTNRCDRMPFSVLLEIALQPCGWLAAYCGSALTSDTDLSFRNLGGSGTQFREIGPDAGTLTVHVTLTKFSKSAGMIIQHYSMKVSNRNRVLYEGTTYFGFFSKAALANQVGMTTAKVPSLTTDSQALSDIEIGHLPHDAPFPAPMLRMVDRIEGYSEHGGQAGLGLLVGSIAVDPSFWFFQAHFYQDPVWPGSLGLESFLQLLKFAAWKRWGNPSPAGWQTVALNQKHEWSYRGQVLPTDREVVVTLEITKADDHNKILTADGFLTVDGRVIYQMTGFTLEY